MVTKMAESVRANVEGMRTAAELRWRDPSRTWSEIAEELRVDPRTIYRWRHSEEWEVIFREAGQEHVEKLAPRAVAALETAWDKGNANGAIEILRSYGFLRNEKIDLDVSLNEPREILREFIEERTRINRERLAEGSPPLPE